MNTELITKLRERTAAPMSACKRALEQNDWNLEAAVDAIKAKNLAVADQ